MYMHMWRIENERMNEHGALTASDCQRAPLLVHGEVGEVHAAAGADRQPREDKRIKEELAETGAIQRVKMWHT